jgi:Tfp pilus assembly protein PilX
MKEIKKLNNIISDESGIAVIIALVMLLVMSIMAISVSFLSNTDFQTMSNFKRGQEAFLAGETCVQETRRRIAEEGLALLLFKQSAQSATNILVDPLDIELSDSNDALPTDSDGMGAMCRSGKRPDIHYP